MAITSTSEPYHIDSLDYVLISPLLGIILYIFYIIILNFPSKALAA